MLEDSAEFNPRKARLACLEECRQADSNQSPIPKSRLALHMVDLVNTSCAMATATVDDTELRILQESAMHLLSAVISALDRFQIQISLIRECSMIMFFRFHLVSRAHLERRSKIKMQPQVVYFYAGVKHYSRFCKASLLQIRLC